MNTPKTTALEAVSICKSYENERIIENIYVNVAEGELVSLLGVSGIGKTTLFHILSGLEKPDSGTVKIYGEEVTGQAGKVSYMQQKDLLLPFETILHNVCIPLLLRGIPKKQAYQQASLYFEEFGLNGCEKKYPSQLSGGMRQRAALLRAYLFSDRIMLLDEPFSALDTLTKTSMHQWFSNIIDAHQTATLFITHDIDEAIILSDRIYIMSGFPGKITHELSMDSQNRRSPEFYTTKEFIDIKREIIKKINDKN